MNESTKPILLATVFSDYICPFCYVGDVRLQQLRDEFELRINWCFLEIHPDTPPQGKPVTELGYEAETWQRMMDTLGLMAEQEGLALAEHDFTTNSHKALLLAEAAKTLGAERFYPLHQRLFEAYFAEGRNIGDESLLRLLAQEAGIPAALCDSAWTDPRFEQRLFQNRHAAEELGVHATPTFFIGEQRLNGAVATEQLLAAARRSVAQA